MKNVDSNDKAGVKNTVKLNEDTEFVPAPGEIMANDSNSLVVHPESELDIEVLEAKNEQRMVNCLNL